LFRGFAIFAKASRIKGMVASVGCAALADAQASAIVSDLERPFLLVCSAVFAIL